MYSFLFILIIFYKVLIINGTRYIVRLVLFRFNFS